jgi:HlyD family secretion protein
VVCLGRIQPAGGLFQIGAPSSVGRPCLVSQLLVAEGDPVRAGQVLAVLDNQSTLESELRQSEAKLQLASTRLVRAKAGPKESDIEAQKAEVARLQADLEQARADAERYARLVKSGDVAAYEADSKRRRVAALDASLAAESARLQGLSEIRPADVEVAVGEVAAARADVARARLALDHSVVRSPIEGRVVHILTKPGEEVGSQAILTLAYSNKMYVLAEVYESDLRLVKVGRRATISSDALPQKLGGVVEKIGMEIGKTTVFPASPAAVTDARVATAYILLDSAGDVMGLIGAQVTVAIDVK